MFCEKVMQIIETTLAFTISMWTCLTVFSNSNYWDTSLWNLGNSFFDRVPCGGRDVGESAPVMSEQNSDCCAPLPPLPAWTTNLTVSFQSFLSILDYFSNKTSCVTTEFLMCLCSFWATFNLNNIVISFIRKTLELVFYCVIKQFKLWVAPRHSVGYFLRPTHHLLYNLKIAENINNFTYILEINRGTAWVVVKRPNFRL